MPEANQDLLSFIRQTQPMLSQEQVNHIAGYFSKAHFPKGHLLVKEHEVSQVYCLLGNGVLRSYTINREGEEVTTGLYTRGMVACELSSFFKRLPSQENYLAMSDCEGWVMPFEQVQQAFHALPYFREFGRAMLVNEYALLKTRSLAGLHQTAEERYAQLMRTSPDIALHVPLKNIASFLGITDSSLSRIRKEFVKK